jgi:hypothetical protein
MPNALRCLEAGDAPAGASPKRLGNGKKQQLDAFALGVFDLTRVGRHLGAGSGLRFQNCRLSSL